MISSAHDCQQVPGPLDREKALVCQPARRSVRSVHGCGANRGDEGIPGPFLSGGAAFGRKPPFPARTERASGLNSLGFSGTFRLSGSRWAARYHAAATNDLQSKCALSPPDGSVARSRTASLKARYYGPTPGPLSRPFRLFLERICGALPSRRYEARARSIRSMASSTSAVLLKPTTTASARSLCMTYCIAFSRSSALVNSPLPQSFMPRTP